MTVKFLIHETNGMAERFSDQEFVEYVARAIVNHPDDVRAERIVDERGVLITLHIHPEDVGYVIGREGQTARALHREPGLSGRRRE